MQRVSWLLAVAFGTAAPSARSSYLRQVLLILSVTAAVLLPVQNPGHHMPGGKHTDSRFLVQCLA